MHSGINECDYTLPSSSTNERMDNLCTCMFCSILSGIVCQTSQ
jgi:hypothetical protein